MERGFVKLTILLVFLLTTSGLLSNIHATRVPNPFSNVHGDAGVTKAPRVDVLRICDPARCLDPACRGNKCGCSCPPAGSDVHGDGLTKEPIVGVLQICDPSRCLDPYCRGNKCGCTCPPASSGLLSINVQAPQVPSLFSEVHGDKGVTKAPKVDVLQICNPSRCLDPYCRGNKCGCTCPPAGST